MKLLYITTRIDGIGGLQRITSVKLNYLAQKGYDINLLTTNSKKDTVYYQISEKIKHIDIHNTSTFLKYKKTIQQTVNQVKPDIIIVADNGLKSFLVPSFLSKNQKIIYEFHATKKTILNSSNRLLNWFGILELLMKQSIKKFDSVVFLTESESKNWATKNTVIIPNPIWFQSNKTTNLTSKKIIFTGRLNHIKGIDYLLQIWKKTSENHSDWKLEIYGEKSSEFDIDNRILQLGLSNSVKVFQHAEDIQEKYIQASIFVSTSRQESFGLSILEAMSCGLACISFDTEGAKSILKNQINGILISDYNLNEYSNKITELILNSEFRNQLGQNAKESSKNYNLDSIMKKWEDLFIQVNS